MTEQKPPSLPRPTALSIAGIATPLSLRLFTESTIDVHISAANGLAVFDPAQDRSVDDVFRRADQSMYANKVAMKAVRTD